MSLATATAAGQPSVRIVLFKKITDEGLHFYTNYLSRKAREMAENPGAAAMIFWPSIDLQVRVNGSVEKLSAAESDAYFATRARASQIGAWASRQSEVLQSRQALEDAVKKYEETFAGKEVPRPPHWGGYILKPREVQMMHRHPHRLHESFRYSSRDGRWVLERLNP